MKKILTWGGILFLVGTAVTVIWLLATWHSGTGDRLGARAPSTLGFLMEEKTRCAQFVAKLHKNGIAGSEDEYEKVFRKNKKCVAYIRGAMLVKGGGNQEEFHSHIAEFRAASKDFCDWADKNLKASPSYSEFTFDPAKFVAELMKANDEQDKQMREELRKEFERCEFQEWDDVIKGRKK